jgi:hypothetical protein
MSSRLAGKGACACDCRFPTSGFGRRPFGQWGDFFFSSAPDGGDMLEKIKWWQWAVGGFLLFMAVGAITTPAPKEGDPHTFARANPKFRLIAGDAIFAMTFDADADPDELPELAREQCGSRGFCKVLGWTDPKYAARGFPLTDREVQQLAFSYSLNRVTNFEQVSWNCERWKRTSLSECVWIPEPEDKDAQKGGS